MKQVILGAGGDIGTLLAKELKAYTTQIRLVSRQPRQVNGDDELMIADLRNEEQADRALAGTTVAYLVIGLPYDGRVWQRDWPLIIRNVLSACMKHGTKLVFFDNVYMYDQAAIPHMTEGSSLGPPSRKGKIRLELAQTILASVSNSGLQAIIARSADFYGPDSKNGILNSLVLSPLTAGKKPIWQSDAGKVHSFTYTPDAARATALLGNSAQAYNQIWHLPTSQERWTGRDYIRSAARIQQVKASFFLLKPWMISLAGIFNRKIAELGEMQYQNNQDYYFDSQKFCKTFDFQPTSYEEGIRKTLAEGQYKVNHLK